MDIQEKTEKFITKTGSEAFHHKTPLEYLPIEFHLGSGSHKPDQKVYMATANIVLWVKFLDGDWFKPFGNFNKEQIIDLLGICENDNQVTALMQMLSGNKN